MAAPTAAVRMNPVALLTMLPRAMIALLRATDPVADAAEAVAELRQLWLAARARVQAVA